MGNVAGMQIEKVGRAVVGFDDCQALRPEEGVRLLTRQDRKQEREVGIVGVEQIKFAQVEGVVARYDGEISVQLIVGLCKQISAVEGV
jgi:hypothetical protein